MVENRKLLELIRNQEAGQHLEQQLTQQLDAAAAGTPKTTGVADGQQSTPGDSFATIADFLGRGVFPHNKTALSSLFTPAATSNGGKR